MVYTRSGLFDRITIMKYPKDIDKKSWDKMVEHTCHTLILLFFVAMVCIVVMMIKDVV